MKRFSPWLLPLAAALLFGGPSAPPASAAAAATGYQGVLREPVVLGAWLYRSSCVRCHPDYEQERLAAEYDTEQELRQAIGGDGCKIAWSRTRRGPFGGRELTALARYMLRWEAEDREPALPELPPLLVVEEQRRSRRPAPKKARAIKLADQALLSPPLQSVVDNNPVALGGWLYTRNCYRCHLAYAQARMGRGVAAETVQRLITEGKTSTQMQAFSRILGGPLKNREIKAVVAYITSWEKADEPLAIAAELMIPPALDPDDFKPLRLPRFPVIGGDVRAGAALFQAHCSRCHGDWGQGALGPSLRERQWLVRTDLFIKSTVKAGVPGSLMPAWDRGAGGRFAPKEIAELVSFVLELAGEGQPSLARAGESAIGSEGGK
ncbi:c-type cytochrome [Desulfogranum mediterraneum]|uniref:c-type cytochrome n=1 Tax=Desulfogranum mediterraneum TaxID=160661 RepID=UPI000422A84F|nr:c-type cytochrome [Desulfogranum mediterraneum]